MAFNKWDELTLESILYPAAFRKAGVRRSSEIATPRMVSLVDFEIPLESVYHHLDTDDVSIGPTKDHVMIKSYSGRMLIEHQAALEKPIGSPRQTRGKTQNTLTTEYRRKQRHFRPLNNYERSLRDRQTLIIFNYSFINHLVFYPTSRYAGYYKWKNIYDTMYSTINKKLKIGDREHFIHVELPQKIPGRKILMKTSKDVKSWEANLVQAFSKPKLHMLHVLWLWLGANRQDSSLSKVDSDKINKLNLVITDGGKYCIVNLGVLLDISGNSVDNQDTDDTGSSMLQRRFLAMLQHIVSLRGEATPPTEDEESLAKEDDVVERDDYTNKSEKTEDDLFDDDLEDIEDNTPKDDGMSSEDKVVIVNEKSAGDDDLFDDELDEIDLLLEEEEDINIADTVRGADYKDPNDALLKKIESLANTGRISVGEYKRYQRLAAKSKELDNPFGDGKLHDFKEVNELDVVISEEEKRLPKIKGVIDDNMLGATVDVLDKKYLSKVLDKDIANMILESQRAGVALIDFKVDQHRDASNDYRVFTMRFSPIDGEVSTVRQRIPNVKKDGTFVSNGVKYIMKKQRGDLPIRKVSPSKVALTSYYAKVFVERSERSVVNYPKWLTNQLNLIAIDREDDRITEARNINSFDHLVRAPRIYTILSKNFKEFKVKGGYNFKLDFSKIEDNFGEIAKEIRENGYTPIAKKGNSIVVCDYTDMLYTYDKGDVTEIGTFESIVNIDVYKAPVEIAEFQLFSKSVPVGIALGMHYGLKELMRVLKVTPRRVPAGGRLNLENHEYAVRFSDESLIFSKQDRVASLILAGFNRYHREIARYTVDSFDNSEVYMNILEDNKIRVGFMRELDLAMDMFVDPITREILEKMKEPLTLDSLLIRSCELLLVDWHPLENDRAYQRDKGYERFAGAMYTELVKSIRRYRSRGAGSDPKLEMNPEATWYAINTDASVAQVEDSNPIHNLKEREAATYSGTGGRSARSMVKRTRSFTVADMGITSEATTDSGTVGINFSLSPDANIKDVRGIGEYKGLDATDNPTSMVSTSALLSPAADHDDQQKNRTHAKLGHFMMITK